MGVSTYTVVDEASSVAPARLFKALCLDNHNVFPTVTPQVIKSIDFVEGDSTVVGCVKQFNFAEGVPYKYLKSKVDELDVENYYVKYTTFEGDVLGDVLDCVVYEAKIEPNGSGSHYKLTAHFHAKGDAVLSKDDAETGLQSMQMSYKAIEEYLCNNPQACT
ncbi:pathogenesis-related protein STH-21-like [Chenopodium quinoa]|uniref:Bet v I/Major latex protein domain-containing protein n=1 Tax=Chenopodium quinoa TaxID=63459 RepID=A0A803NBL5_CHEQI|nr:pathogenesis-related protein STH-21-like [Chenopodium quinoa]